MQEEEKTARKRKYLEAMGVDVWVRRRIPETCAEEPAGQSGTGVAEIAAAAEPLSWDALSTAVAGCTRCALHQTRTQTVFGTGDRHSHWLVVGEAPGAEEDKQGEPFVGRAGQLLNSMLGSIGLSRQQVYIANVLKCRPPANRDPQLDEVLNCEPHLLAQIALLRPRIILAVGRIAAQNLLKVTTPIGKLRGQRHVLGPTGIPLVVTYHPAYLLRSPADKRRAWQELMLARQVYQALA